MSVHYKFKSAVEYDTLPVDGLNISLGDLKEAIIQQKRLGKGQPYDLQITNAETKEVYVDEKILIPKNSSLIVARVPIDPSQMKRPWENKEATALILSNPSNLMNTEDAAEAAQIDRKIKEVTDLTRMEGSEQDKINAMVAQSTMEYHPSKYVKLRASKMTGVVPLSYKCYKCSQAGHWVTMCPLNNADLRKSTGIPSMFLEEVKDPNAPGVMISATGKLVRLRDSVDNIRSGMDNPPIERQPVPEELECPLCKEILKDAVLIPCCAAAFCDECIRNHLLDTEEHICPSCEKEGIGPDTLIPVRYLRIKVQQFECGCFFSEKKSDGSSDVEPVLQSSNPPTPPHSPAHTISPARIRTSDKPTAASPTSQTAVSPINESAMSPISETAVSPTPVESPSKINVIEPIVNGIAKISVIEPIVNGNAKISVIEPIGNGSVESDREMGLVLNENSGKAEEIHTDVNEREEIHNMNEGGEEIRDVNEGGEEIRDVNDGGEEIRDVNEGGEEIHDDVNEKDCEPLEKHLDSETQPIVEEKENIGENEVEAEVDEKPKKIKKKKSKRKNSRYESDDEKEEKERKKRERRASHRTQDKKGADKSKHRGMELVKDVEDLLEDKTEQWDESNMDEKMLLKHEGDVIVPKKKKKHRTKTVIKNEDSEEENEVPGNSERLKMSDREYVNRSRSSSGDKEKETAAIYENIVPFNPLVPPPNVFVKSPPEDYRYPVPSTFVPQVPPTHPPVPAESPYPHYQPGLIADPLTEFQKHLREKDELKRKWRYSRSRSPSRSPRYRRVRSRSRQRSWSRSRSRSLSRVRGNVSARSPPRSPSRRRWSRSPLPRGHASYRSRSPSFPREQRSLSDCSLSLSRTPSPNRRIMTPPPLLLPVHPPAHPDPHVLARNPVEYGAPREYNRYQPLPTDQFAIQPPYIPSQPPPHWDQHARYNQPGHENFKPNFPDQRGRGNMDSRGRGNRGRRGRGGNFRQGENFAYDHRNQDYRHQYDRSQHMHEDRRGMQGPGVWEREGQGRQCFNTEIPRNDRSNRHSDNERRRYVHHSEFEDRQRRDNTENIIRRLDEVHSQNEYSDEEDWRRIEEVRKREEESHRRRFEGRRGHDDRKDDSDLRKASDIDDYDYKRTRKDGDGSKNYERGFKDVDDGRSGRLERGGGKHRGGGVSRRESPREEEMLFRSKSYDSPGKSHNKKSPLRDRREGGDRRDKEVDKRDKDSDRRDRESDRRDRDGDRRDRDSDKRDRLEVDRKGKDGDRRDLDRRERDDRRDRDVGKQERDSDRKEKEYDRKDTYKRDRDQDRKLRDGDKRDKEGDRRERETLKKDKDFVNKDKSERNDDRDRDPDRSDNKKSGKDMERAYVSRWDHGTTKLRSEKEMEKKSKSQERERSVANEEKEHKRKSKRKEEKEEGHHTKEKVDAALDIENPTKVEKKKHDKKKKKKEKRRASQASTEASQGEVSGDEGEDKKKKRKREKKRKTKGTVVEEESQEIVDNNVPVIEEKPTGDGDPTEPVGEAAPETNEEEAIGPEMTPRERTPEPNPSEESPLPLLPIPPLSKWERDEDLTLTPKGLVENKAPEEEKKVTVDILKRAENHIFSGRSLAPRKVYLDPQKQKETEEKERSPTPEWDRMELREAKRRGPSIQITISSKTESQIGRPRGGGRYPQSSPERPEERRYTLRSRKVPDADKTEKHTRTQKRSQSPAEPQSTIRTRRRSEKEQLAAVVEKESSVVSTDRSDVNDESIISYEKLKVHIDIDKNSVCAKDMDNEEDVDQNEMPDTQQKLENVPELSSKPCNNLLEDNKHFEVSDRCVKEEKNTVHKGVKRSSSSADELEVKKLKREDEPPVIESDESKNVCRIETIANVEEKISVALKGEPEYSIPVLGESSIKQVTIIKQGTSIKQVPNSIKQVTNSNLVMVPIATGEAEELEEGEITDSSSEGNTHYETEPRLVAPLELRGMVPIEETEEVAKGLEKIRYSPIRVPSPVQPSRSKETMKVKEKSKKRKKRKRSSSTSSSNSTSSSSSSSSEDEEIVKKKKKKKKKKKAVDSDSSDGESQRKHKKKKKEKKKKKKKEKKKKSDK